MIRKLMAGSAVIALISAGAFTASAAETTTSQATPAIEEDMTAAPATNEAAAAAALTPEQPTLASVFIGRSVFSSADPESDNIGDVNDLIVDENGTVTHAVVGVGGFLGIGEKDVAVPFDELEVVERDGDIRLIYAATREELEAAPALERTAYDPIARYNEEQAAMTDAQGGMAPATPPAGDMTVAPEDTAATEAPAVEPAPAPAEEQTAATETPAAEPEAAPAEGQDLAAAPAEEPEAAAPAEEEVAATETAPAAAGEIAFVTASADQLQASDLMGKAVYGAENESIGEISDLVLEPEGETRVALIDVGGFLGVGEKTVGIAFDQLQVATAEDGSEQVNVAMSKQELEALPAIETDTDTASTDATQPAAEPSMSAEQPADTAQAPATDDITTGSVEQPVQYEPITQEIAASQLIGATVYGPDDANLGEVSDVLFAKTGDIEGAVIDVGGFLGIGEKPVAIGFDALKVGTDQSGTMTVMVDANQEQLEQAPAFEEPEASTSTVQ